MADARQQDNWRYLAQAERVGDVGARGSLPGNDVNALAVELVAHSSEVIGANAGASRRWRAWSSSDSDLGQDARASRDGHDGEAAGRPEVGHLLGQQITDVHRRRGTRAVRIPL